MKTILVIEDNLQVRENIAEILELSNYKVLKADDGKIGIEIALREKPDLIICDIMMPVLDGYGVLHLLNKHTETYGIPFIFLTAKSEKNDRRKGMEMGADDYITKPFDGIDLLNAIEARLKKSESLRTHTDRSRNNVDDFIDKAKKSCKVQLISNEREVIDINKKYVLYTEGQKNRAVYYILKGKIKTYKTNDDGKEFITNVYTKCDFLGYNNILESNTHTESAEVLEDATVMLIPAEDFVSLLNTDTQVAKQFIQLITKNIIEKEDRLVNMAYSSLRKKVAYALIQILEKYRKDINDNEIIELSRETLAQITGVATESLIRTFADFKSENLIALSPSKITILNEYKLRNLPY
jgi:CRP/FNR family transcriptional regulator, cyclic AMP receptor protein